MRPSFIAGPSRFGERIQSIPLDRAPGLLVGCENPRKGPAGPPSSGRSYMFENFAEYGYIGVFAALLAAGFGLPIPEELPVLTAGVLVGHADTLKGGATVLDPHRLHWYF